MVNYSLTEEGAILTYCRHYTADKMLCDECVKALTSMTCGGLSRRCAYNVVSRFTGASCDFDLIVSILSHIRRSNVKI